MKGRAQRRQHQEECTKAVAKDALPGSLTSVTSPALSDVQARLSLDPPEGSGCLARRDRALLDVLLSHTGSRWARVSRRSQPSPRAVWTAVRSVAIQHAPFAVREQRETFWRSLTIRGICSASLFAAR